jgi:hypothetical protein
MDVDEFSKLKNNIVKKVVKELKQTYIILNKNGQVMKEDDIIKSLSNNSKCIGVSQGVRCSKAVFGNSDYCKTHSVKKLTKCDYPSLEIEYVFDIEEKMDTSKLSKTFIEDTFYYIDIMNSFIYTKDGIKAGIVSNDEYILTSDPYIINNN